MTVIFWHISIYTIQELKIYKINTIKVLWHFSEKFLTGSCVITKLIVQIIIFNFILFSEVRILALVFQKDIFLTMYVSNRVNKKLGVPLLYQKSLSYDFWDRTREEWNTLQVT